MKKKIKFIYGADGSGKTKRIFDMLAEDCNNGVHSFLIVPDQEALQFERLSLSVLPVQSQLNLEILGFSRLYNRVCRVYGGLSYSYISKPMRSLMMWKTLEEVAPLLESFPPTVASDMPMCETLMNTVVEFKTNGITAQALQKAIRDPKLPDDSVLAARLRDLLLIYTCYNNFVSEKYTDSADDLSRLRDILMNNSFFKGAHVYIDSFYAFSSVQHQIIEEIFKSAENITITIPLLSPAFDNISTESVKYSHDKLLNSANRYGGAEEINVGENKRAQSPALAYLSRNLWNLASDTQGAPEPDGSIICESCANPYAEAEAVAAHILKLMREGARAKDMVIIARDADKYRGIIDNALQKSEIPFYMAEKSDLCSLPAVKLILCALRIKKYNWRRRDVVEYVKTGLCGVCAHDVNLFEEYIDTWNIEGARFLDGPWTMNPDGIVAKASPRGDQIRSTANRVREQITDSLYKYFVMLDASNGISDMCRATYQYLVDVKLEQSLSALAQDTAARGELKQARELSVLYETIISLLADIGEIFEDEPATDTDKTEAFILILRHIFDQTEIGSIPTSVDEVTVGSAGIFRAANVKYAFIVGLCEGEFPANVTDNGLFSDNERQFLSTLNIELLGNINSRSSDELMFVQRAFCAPSERLYLFTHKTETDGDACFPSLAFNRVKALLPNIAVHNYSVTDLGYLTPSANNAVAVYRSLAPSPEKEALAVALGEHIAGFKERAEISDTKTECRVSDSTVISAMGKSLHLSPTVFEKYASCPFSYFCSNVLKLRSKTESTFAYNTIGSFVHYILEVLISKSFPSDPDKKPPTDDELERLADETVEAYLKRVCPPHMLSSKKMQHLYKRLRELSLMLVHNIIREFSKSEFVPKFFELNINGEGENPAPLKFKLSNGTELSFSGKIDRVDVYKHNGEVYIRVVDYKTGKKLFSVSDIDYGINLQMLLYLFTLCRSESAGFKSALNISPEQMPLPAGVIYLSSAISAIDAEDFLSSEFVLKKAEDSLPRTGLLLNNIDILTAMHSELDEKFLAGIKNDKGTLSGKALTSAERFDEIYNEIEATVIRLGEELQSGNADARPYTEGPDTPCKYCSYKPICRKMNNQGGEYYG